MNRNKNRDLIERTKRFALLVIELYTTLPKRTEAQVLGKQLLRSGTSVGSQFREAQRAKSDADFISKIEGVLQELDESSYWLELLDEAHVASNEKLRPMLKETDELIAIFVSIVKKVKGKGKQVQPSSLRLHPSELECEV